MKNKLKSEILNDKKVYKQKWFFSVIITNLNWKVLTKNLVAFKRWDGIKDEKFYWVSPKNSIFKWVHKKPIYRGNCLKRVAWTVFSFRGGGAWQKKERGIFERG